MKLSDLQAFADIVDAGGLTAAAARRGVTQPALSRLLRDLETRLRAQLLHRTGRGIEVTQAGAAFLEFAVETLRRYDETRSVIAERAKTLPQRLQIAVPLRVGRLVIPDLLRDFGTRFPDIAVHVVEESTDRCREMIAEGRLDAAVTYRPTAKPAADFVPLFSETMCAVGSARLLGTDRAPIPMAELNPLPLLLPSTGSFTALVRAAFRAAGHDLRPARELETSEGLLAFAAEGEGVAVLPTSSFCREIARGEVTARSIADPEISRCIGVHLSAGLSKHAASAVIAVLRGALSKSAATAAWRRVPARSRPFSG